MAQSLRVALVQMACSEDPGANLAKACSRVREASRKGAHVISLPELFRSRYFPQIEDRSCFRFAEPVPGPTTESLGALARECGAVIVAPVFEKGSQGVYHNTAVILDADGTIAGTYRKMHIPDDSLYREKFYFAPGDLGFPTYQTRYARIGVLICWDQWFPEAARIAALGGAQILFFPTAIGSAGREPAAVVETEFSAWETIQRAHAIANGFYVAAVNRVGREGRLHFWGGSFVAGPFGKLIARAGRKKEQILLAECDLGKMDEIRSQWPFLRDRRNDAYAPIASQFLDQKRRASEGKRGGRRNLQFRCPAWKTAGLRKACCHAVPAQGRWGGERRNLQFRFPAWKTAGLRKACGHAVPARGRWGGERLASR